MNIPKVSIIIPCYNSEAYVQRCLDSILTQTYKNIDVVCVDDGSTDDTRDIISLNKALFTAAGMSIQYIYQDNRGQAAAVQLGLSCIANEGYLCQVDSDDFLLPNHIEKMVSLLENNPDYGVAICDAFISNEDAPTVPIGRVSDNNSSMKNEWKFNDTLTVPVGMPSLYLIRLSDFAKVNPQKRLYWQKSSGQNYQMLLPLFYRFKCIYTDTPLTYIVQRNDSHSRIARTNDELLSYYENCIVSIKETLRLMNLPEWEVLQYVQQSSVYRTVAILKISDEMMDAHTQKLLSFCDRFECVYVFGKGGFGKAIGHFIEGKNIPLGGYVTSAEVDSFAEKYNKRKTGLILGLRSEFYHEIMPELSKFMSMSDVLFLSEEFKRFIQLRINAAVC